MQAVAQLRRTSGLLLVEHHAESVLPLVDRAVVLVNGAVAYEGSATGLAADAATQARLLGLADPSTQAA
jgi:ABC-type branched-subunit amino acid transport system ATPase component